MKVKIKKWTTVAAWHWVANDDSCGICRNLFDGCCTECTLPGDSCPIAWGKCSHCFHMHCIYRWISSNTNKQQCPMCRRDWAFKEGDVGAIPNNINNNNNSNNNSNAGTPR